MSKQVGKLLTGKVSVIIPTYNAVGTIVRCVNSLLVQTYSNIEIIVVDDGSEDNTVRVLREKFGDKIILLRQKNLGVSAARNNGIRRSTGSYVMFADADDTFNKDTVEALLSCAVSNEVEIVRGGVIEIFMHTKQKERSDPLSGAIINTNDMNDRAKVIEYLFGEKATRKCLVMALLIKKDFLVKNDISFNEDLYMMEDVVFYADIILSGTEIYFSEIPSYNYYQYSKSASHDIKKTNRTIMGIINANNEMNKRLNGNASINNRHFKMIFGLLATASYKDVSDSLLKRVKVVALRTDFADGRMFWRIAKKMILYSNRLSILVLLMIKKIQFFLHKRKDMI